MPRVHYLPRHQCHVSYYTEAEGCQLSVSGSRSPATSPGHAGSLAPSCASLIRCGGHVSNAQLACVIQPRETLKPHFSISPTSLIFFPFCSRPSHSLSTSLSLFSFFCISSLLLQFFFISSSSCYCIIVLHFGCADLRLKGWFYWSKLEGFLLTNL